MAGDHDLLQEETKTGFDEPSSTHIGDGHRIQALALALALAAQLPWD